MVAFAMSPKLQQKARRYFEEEELPKEIAWVECLTPVHKRLFAADLKKALDLAPEDNGALLREVIESLEATASVDADPKLRKTLQDAPRNRKRYTVWEPSEQSTK